jgi:hypothetical protein
MPVARRGWTDRPPWHQAVGQQRRRVLPARPRQAPGRGPLAAGGVIQLGGGGCLRVIVVGPAAHHEDLPVQEQRGCVAGMGLDHLPGRVPRGRRWRGLRCRHGRGRRGVRRLRGNQRRLLGAGTRGGGRLRGRWGLRGRRRRRGREGRVDRCRCCPGCGRGHRRGAAATQERKRRNAGRESWGHGVPTHGAVPPGRPLRVIASHSAR